MFDLFARHGEPFDRVGGFKGYNEVIVESATWLRNLPWSVEAIFQVACEEGDVNALFQYNGVWHLMQQWHLRGGTASRCGRRRCIRRRRSHCWKARASSSSG